MDNSNDKYVERMLEISRTKYALLGKILELTKKQAGTISEDGIENLQQLIDEKQKHIEAIDKLDDEFNVYFSRFKSVLNVAKLSELDASKIKGASDLKEVTGNIMKLIKEIEDLERTNNDKANTLFTHIGKEINKISMGKIMNAAYRPKQKAPPAIFFDKKK